MSFLNVYDPFSDVFYVHFVIACVQFSISFLTFLYFLFKIIKSTCGFRESKIGIDLRKEEFRDDSRKDLKLSVTKKSILLYFSI